MRVHWEVQSAGASPETFYSMWNAERRAEALAASGRQGVILVLVERMKGHSQARTVLRRFTPPAR